MPSPYRLPIRDPSEIQKYPYVRPHPIPESARQKNSPNMWPEPPPQKYTSSFWFIFLIVCCLAFLFQCERFFFKPTSSLAPTQQDFILDNTRVHWAQESPYYHYRLGCSQLSRSLTVYSGTLRQATNARYAEECPTCREYLENPPTPAPAASTAPPSSSGGSRHITDSLTGPAHITAYWTEYGKSYHFNPNCGALTDSRQVYSGSLLDAISEGKSDPCDFCAGGKNDS